MKVRDRGSKCIPLDDMEEKGGGFRARSRRNRCSLGDLLVQFEWTHFHASMKSARRFPAQHHSTRSNACIGDSVTAFIAGFAGGHGGGWAGRRLECGGRCWSSSGRSCG
jgi:hypothetical protein